MVPAVPDPRANALWRGRERTMIEKCYATGLGRASGSAAPDRRAGTVGRCLSCGRFERFRCYATGKARDACCEIREGALSTDDTFTAAKRNPPENEPGVDVDPASLSREDSGWSALKAIWVIGWAWVVAAFCGLVRSKAVALVVGPVGTGILGFQQNSVDTVSVVSGLGFPNVSIRHIAAEAVADRESSLSRAVAATAVMGLVLGIAGATVFVTLHSSVPQGGRLLSESAKGVLTLAMAVVAMVLSNNLGAALNGLGRTTDIALTSVISGAGATFLGVALLLVSRRDALPFFCAAPPAISALVATVFLRRHLVIGLRSLRKSDIRSQFTLARDGVLFMAAGFLSTGGLLVIRGLVVKTEGEISAGLFQAVWTLSTFYLGFVLNAMAIELYPRLVSLRTRGVSTVGALEQQTRLALWLCGPAAVLIVAAGPILLSAFFSARFLAGTTALRWLIVASVIRIALWPLGFNFLAKGRNVTYLFLEGAGSAIFIGVSWALLPRVGLAGSGVAFFLACALSLALQETLLWREEKRGLGWKVHAEIAVPICLAGVVLLLEGVHPALGLPSGAALSALLALRNARKVEKEVGLSVPSLVRAFMSRKAGEMR